MLWFVIIAVYVLMAHTREAPWIIGGLAIFKFLTRKEKGKS